MQPQDELKKAERIRYVARELVDEVHTLLSFPNLSLWDIKVLCKIITTEASRETIYKKLDDSLWNDGGEKIWMDKVWLTQFKNQILNELSKRADTELGLSQLLLLMPRIKTERGHRDDFANDIFIRRMTSGEIGIVYGDLGSGKTDITVNEIIKPALAKGLPVVSNIYIKKFQPNMLSKRFKYTNSLSEMLLFVCEKAVESLKKYNWVMPVVRVTDDSGLSRLKQRASTPQNIAQRQLTILNRKLGIFDWFLYQLDWDVPTEVQRFCTHDILKPSSRNLDIATLRVKGKKGRCFYHFRGIRGMDDRKNMGLDYLEFETHHWEMTDPDINVLKLFSYVCEIGREKPLSTIEQYEAIIGWIKRYKGEFYLDKKSIIDVLKLIRKIHPNMSYRELGDLVGWDSERVRRNIIKSGK